MTKTVVADDAVEILSSEQFQPREDDDELLWDVIEIIGEKRHGYKVRWAGEDPTTGKEWDPTWVKKGDVTDDLVKKWKLKKKTLQEEKVATRVMKKSGKRASTVSAATARQSSSTRTSKTSTATPSNAENIRSDRETASADGGVIQQGPSSKAKIRLSRPAAEAASHAPEASTSSKRDEGLKRKRVRLTPSPSPVDPPITVHDTPAQRPRKRVKLGSAVDAFQISSEEESTAWRKSKHSKPIVSDYESEEETFFSGQKAVDAFQISSEEESTAWGKSKHSKPIASDYEGEEETFFSRRKAVDKTKKNGSTFSRRADEDSEEENEEGHEGEESEEEVEIVSTPRVAQTRHQPQKANGPMPGKRRIKYATKSVPYVNGDKAPTASKRRTTSNPQREHQITSKRPSEPATKPRPAPSLELSPEVVKRLQQFDAELEELDRERKRQEVAKKGYVPEEHSLEYFDEPPPLHSPSRTRPSPPSKRSSNILSKPVEPVRQPTKSAVALSAKRVNGKSSGGTHNQEVVPETEFEDSGGNTQSQSPSHPHYSQPMSSSQLLPSIPSLAVEAPTSQSLTPSRLAQPRASGSRTRFAEEEEEESYHSPDEFNRVEEPTFQDASQDADISAPIASYEPPESQELPSPPKNVVKTKSKFAPYFSSKRIGSSLNGKSRGQNDGPDEPMSSIEQFSSPEKSGRSNDISGSSGKGKGKAGARANSMESDSIRRRGQELAEDARQAWLQNRGQAAKRPLTQILSAKLRNALKNGVRSPSAPPINTIEPLSSSLATSLSQIATDSEPGLPEVSEEQVQEMEAAYVDLDGGANKQTEDETMEDDSASLPKPPDHTAITNASIQALRQEEEESSQDALPGAPAPADQVVDNGREENESEMNGAQPTPPVIQEPERGTPTRVEPSPAIVVHQAQGKAPSASIGTPVRSEPAQQEPHQSQEDEILTLRKALELAKAVTDHQATQLLQLKAEYEKGKAEWESERASLTSAAAAAGKANEDAVKETTFFREQYTRASAFVTSVRDENVELEKRAKIAEDQAKSGVAMIKATYETRVTELLQHVEKWQMMATFLIQKDQRTDNDELRRRAAEEPELRARCQTLEDIIARLTDQLLELEDLPGEVNHWKKEAEHLATKLNDKNAEMERLRQASVANDLVYRCIWRLESSKQCEEVFSTVQELQQHLFSAGHIRWD